RGTENQGNSGLDRRRGYRANGTAFPKRSIREEAAERPPLSFMHQRATRICFGPCGIVTPNALHPLIEPTIFLLLSQRRFFRAPSGKMQLAAGFPASNTYLLVIDL